VLRRIGLIGFTVQCHIAAAGKPAFLLRSAPSIFARGFGGLGRCLLDLGWLRGRQELIDVLCELA
jgi:hypothetical protein